MCIIFLQGNDIDVTDTVEKAETSRYSRSYTSGATLGAELRRGRTRRLSPSLQVLVHNTGIFFYSGFHGIKKSCGPLQKDRLSFQRFATCHLRFI